MLSSDTRSSETAYHPEDEELTTPTFRKELEEVAPDLLSKFDSCWRHKTDEQEEKNVLIEEYARRYKEAKADLAKTRATALSNETDDGHVIMSLVRSAGGFTDYSGGFTNFSGAWGQSASNTVPSHASAETHQIPEAKRSSRRIALTDSTRSNGTQSDDVREIPEAKRGTKRMALTDSTNSNGTHSQDFAHIPEAKRATHRVALTDSTGDDPSRSNGASQLPHAIVSKHRASLTGSTRSNRPWRYASFTEISKITTAWQAILTMKVQIRLLPVIQLLSASDLTPAVRGQARELARTALHYATESEASPSLVARCSFYIALSFYDSDDGTTTQDAVNWFNRALDATDAGFPEGQWAQEWLNHYQSVTLAANSRPSTAGSWVAGKVNDVWNLLRGAKDSDPGAAASVSPSAHKPRPSGLLRYFSDDASRPNLRGERIPSFSTAENNSVSPTSSGTQDHHGLKWSPKSPWGKGEIVNGQKFELVHSPEPIYEEDEDEEKHIPANIHGGLVEASALSPAMQRTSAQQQQHRRVSDAYVPPGVVPRQWRITNLTSPPESPQSPGSLAGTKKQSPTRTSYFARHAANTQPHSRARHAVNTQPHSRAQSFAAYPSAPLPVSPPTYAQSERPSSPSGSSTASRNKKKCGSISHLLTIATGFAHPGKRDEAAQMEEGHSPAFAPEGLYRRRSNDVAEEEDV